jgi:hypothetical protein
MFTCSSVTYFVLTVDRFASRNKLTDSTSHSLAGTMTVSPALLASQISLDINKCWGALKLIIDVLMAHEDGEYLILKDPMKVCIHFVYFLSQL